MALKPRGGVTRSNLLTFAVVIVTLTGQQAIARVSNHFGAQDRADAAARMIVLGVQQGISSLPPTSGQALTYEFDPELSTLVPTERLAPTAFRVPQTIGQGKLSLRVAGSYFELSDTFEPINYLVELEDGSPDVYVKLGLHANAKVGLVNLSGSYGLTNRIEVAVNFPLVLVDAQASQLFSTSNPGDPIDEARLSGAFSIADLDLALSTGQLAIREESFRDLGFCFNEGTEFGLGRIGLAAKGVLLATDHLQLAIAPELFIPSPNEDGFAGSESFAILPRLIGQVPLSDVLRVHVDAGYEYDFDNAELRRFVWNAGASVAMKRFSFDAGVGGSEFDVPIRWTPNTARSEETADFPEVALTALNDNRVGDTFIDFLGGVKVGITDNVVLAAAASVPLNSDGFRADAMGTVAIEISLP